MLKHLNPMQTLLSTSAASGALTVAAACTSEISVLNFIAKYVVMELQYFVLYYNAFF